MLPKNVMDSIMAMSPSEKKALKSSNPELYERFEVQCGEEVGEGTDKEIDDAQIQEVIRQWINMPPIVAKLADTTLKPDTAGATN